MPISPPRAAGLAALGPRPRAFAGLTALVASAILACATCGPAGSGPTKTGPVEPPAAPPRLTLDLVAFARVMGAVAPCGCTTEPLGGLQYVFGYLGHDIDPQRRLVVEPGGLLIPDPKGPEAPHDEAAWAQAYQRAGALQERFASLGGSLVSGVGANDLSSPLAQEALKRWPLPRVLANSRAFDALGVVPHRVVDIPGADGKPALQLGVTAVHETSPEAVKSLGPLEPTTSAAKREVAAMRAAGADVVIVLVHGTRAAAVEVAEGVPGADIVVTGIPEGTEKARLGAPATRVGHGWVLEPGDQAQTLTRVRLSIDPSALAALPGPDAWKVQPSAAAQAKELERLDARLAKFRADPAADAGYIARLEQERAALASAMAGDAAPAGAVAVTFEQQKITCKLPVDAAGADALRSYDAWVATQNQQRFAGVKPPAPAKGQASYIGGEQCGACHDKAEEHWATTRHAGAYETLVKVNKQFDLSCVGCHVTGFRQPGGSEVVEVAGLEDVQCEVCHGPGSIHAETPEKAGKAFGIRREAAVDVCLGCHTAEHSDTFNYEAYLRDVLGAGHGEGRRALLGDGPTGRELRAAGLEKAGGACPKQM
ncbi:multiheme c-type cytochrome [Nannocystis sp. RBIL2]|uniref:multiheme c-type cytochrome n=1 Tax=Nannocystis sp. RBIL2 TaxID=2996788 RepID=UPI00226EE327|nr:multiheme c-type cytochrome [Nannocystis sp. RBIL2]MCY1072380.1 multiheme c-type cytochrome [Nannocystis sp. RBIL2]